MSSIFSASGLVSGLDINSIVDNLMRIEARPRDQLQSRIGTLDQQRTAFLEVSARISALLGRISALSKANSFRATRASSSAADVLSATTGDNVAPGAYQFIVRGLASTHQLVSSGVRDAAAPLGGGSLTIESARARVNRAARLDELNGYTGVQRGAFQITDGDGSTATINLGDAVTLDEVVERINAAGIDVEAEVRNEALVLREANNGVIRVREVSGGRTAADLGFGAGLQSATGTLAGASLARLRDASPLSGLNDGRGLRRIAGGGDFRVTGSAGQQFSVDLSGILNANTRLERLNAGRGVQPGEIRITNRQGRATTIDLAGATTIGQVKERIDAANAGVTVVLNAGRLLVSDSTSATSGTLKIEDVGSGGAARDLGIAAVSDSNKIEGRTVLMIDTLGDVLRAINYAHGNDGSVRAALDPQGQSLSITDTGDGSTGRVILEALNGSNALRDLGFAGGDYSSDEPARGARIASGINTTLLSSLNGGRGLAAGTIHVAAGAAAFDADLSGAVTLQEVVQRINSAAGAANAGIEATIDSTGTRLQLANIDGGTTAIQVTDISGGFAAASGLDRAAQDGVVRGSNLQRQWINENTRLAELNAGRGVAPGKFRITDSDGRAAVVDLTSTATTLADVMRAINDSAVEVTARINDSGDGLLLEDTAGGTGTLKVEDQGGTAAKDLNLLGPAAASRIDGSYELSITIGAADTLNSLVGRINEKTAFARATVLNDGSPVSPYRLNIAAAQSGAAGELIVDAGALGLNFSTLSRAADARVLVGSSGEAGLLITSASNTVTNVVNGLTLNLSAVSEDPVTVTVDRNYETVLTALKGFVTDFNAATERIKKLSDYDQTSNQSGPLLGDGTIQTIENRLFRMATGQVSGVSGNFTRLSQIGLRFGDGGDLTFDETRFKEAFARDPEGVIRFFTDATNGVASKLKKDLDAITDKGGLIDRRGKAIEQQKTALSGRVDDLNDLLERKRERLLRQFRAMEEAIAGLQSQQAALGSIDSFGAR